MTAATLVERVRRVLERYLEGTDSEFDVASRMVIEAMREPTERMLSHGVGYTDFILPHAIGSGHEDYLQEMKCAWTVMIDAALKGEG